MYVWLNILGGFILQKTNFLSKKIQVNESIFVLRHKIKRILVFHEKEMNHVSMYFRFLLKKLSAVLDFYLHLKINVLLPYLSCTNQVTLR